MNIDISVVYFILTAVAIVLGTVALKKANESGTIVVNPETIGNIEETLSLVYQALKLALKDDRVVDIVYGITVDVLEFAEFELENGYVISKEKLNETALELLKEVNVKLTADEEQIVYIVMTIIFKYISQ